MTLTQLQRVERAGWAAGSRGICQTDFLAPNVCDGGPPITRLAARIKDSRDAGAKWTVTGERNACAVYVLDRESLARATKPPTTTSGPPSAASPAPPPQADEGGTGALFQIGRPQQSAINDDWDTAA